MKILVDGKARPNRKFSFNYPRSTGGKAPRRMLDFPKKPTIVGKAVVEIMLIHPKRLEMDELAKSIENLEIFEHPMICKEIASFLNPIFATHTLIVSNDPRVANENISEECDSEEYDSESF